MPPLGWLDKGRRSYCKSQGTKLLKRSCNDGRYVWWELELWRRSSHCWRCHQRQRDGLRSTLASLLLPSGLPTEPPTGQAQPEAGQAQPEAGQHQHLGNVACKCQDREQTPAKASCGSRNRPRILSGALINLFKLLVRKLLYSFRLLSHFLSIQLKMFQRNT